MQANPEFASENKNFLDVLDTLQDSYFEANSAGFVTYANRVFYSTYAFHNLAHHAEIFRIIPEFEQEVSMLDVAKIPMVIERGRQTTREQLDHIKQVLGE